MGRMGIMIVIAMGCAAAVVVVAVSPPSQAQAAGFHAIAVSATQSGNTGFAWIVGSDGSARFCTNGSGTVTCQPVHY